MIAFNHLWSLWMLFSLNFSLPPASADDWDQQQMQQVTTLTSGEENPNRTIYIAGIFDNKSFEWGQEVFEFLAHEIKTQQQSYYSSFEWLPSRILQPTDELKYTVVNAACDETTAVRAYWDLRRSNGNRPMHGIVGCRCSGASISLARIAGLEQVPQVSPWSTSAKLSDNDEFPYFSRLVGPDDGQGEVGALVALLRGLGWDRVTTLTVINSNGDTEYAKGLELEFKSLWVGGHYSDHDDGAGGSNWNGEIAHSETIDLANEKDYDNGEGTTRQVLSFIENDPTIRSRVIVLFANNDDAWPVLRTANEMNFGPGDTIWIGVSAWVNRMPPKGKSWIPPIPGYIGLTYYFNRNNVYTNFLSSIKRWQFDTGRAVWTDHIPSVIVQYMVDSIVSLTRAIASVRMEERRNGELITSNLRNQKIEGVSGWYEFSDVGDRLNPTFTVMNLQESGWVEIGSTGVTPGSFEIYHGGTLCLAQYGCNLDLDSIPSDSYPESKDPLPIWVIVLIASLLLLFLALAFKYWRSRKSKLNIREELDKVRDSVFGMRAVEVDYIPMLNKEKQNKSNAVDTNMAIADKSPVNVQWCWQETDHRMRLHKAKDVLGDPKDCWIKYDDEYNSNLETAFQEQACRGIFTLITKDKSGSYQYEINFHHMVQTNVKTGFQRTVQRLVQNDNAHFVGGQGGDGAVANISSKAEAAGIRVGIQAKYEAVSTANQDKQRKQIKLDDGKQLTAVVPSEIPSDLEGEPKMVLVQDDIVQISKQRTDGWTFGTKLYHANEVVARELKKIANANSVVKDEEESDIFTDTGWFELDVTRIPNADDLTAMQNNVGDTGALEPPSHWDPIADPSLVQKHALSSCDPEYKDLVDAFKSTLIPRSQNKVGILKVERIQNLAMYQSYVVKRQTICNRETGLTGAQEKNDIVHKAGIEQIKKMAKERFEKKWLWHGTNDVVMEKILQQGFNRSFCGKNATMYGKGVYFARDAEYSAHRSYAVPDREGCQYMMACRVVVGEYCVGRKDVLTPDVRDYKSQALYDSTVGLKGSDTLMNPSIYVTYHDAQAYPDYLIKFRLD